MNTVKLENSRYYIFDNETYVWYRDKDGNWSMLMGGGNCKTPWNLNDDTDLIHHLSVNKYDIKCFLTKEEVIEYQFIENL